MPLGLAAVAADKKAERYSKQGVVVFARIFGCVPSAQLRDDADLVERWIVDHVNEAYLTIIVAEDIPGRFTWPGNLPASSSTHAVARHSVRAISAPPNRIKAGVRVR